MSAARPLPSKMTTGTGGLEVTYSSTDLRVKLIIHQLYKFIHRSILTQSIIMNDDSGGFQNWSRREHITQLEWQNLHFI